MPSNRCHRCGSFNLIADRALAGKIICSDCGTPILNSYRSNNSIFTFKKSNRSILLLLLCIFLIIIILS